MPYYTLTNSEDLVVVVTGCDSGFGAEILNDLYQRCGSTIYATCLTFQAVEKYQAKEGRFDLTAKDAFERMMDVNYKSIIRATKALLPFLRAYTKSRHILPDGQKQTCARLISVTSVADRTNAPGLGPYSAFKHAAESILDTLRVKLSPWEIDVSMIEPFFAKTPIMTNSFTAFEQNWKRVDDHVHAMYGPAFVESAHKRNQFLYEKAMPPQWVVQAAVNAIRKNNGTQTSRTLVGFWYVRFLVWFLERAHEWVVDGMLRSVQPRKESNSSKPMLTLRPDLILIIAMSLAAAVCLATALMKNANTSTGPDKGFGK
ncbi:hypothetical protein EC957_009111 [Mortierella hygrophila]|uniref:Uncharacterized protein n=1 Tax=Mortierella hygrophila TaxID=979708 RepID=A0A9P6FBH3_9FUNG|nr:hypothetical protein EC957_009111 [Mortierella hygrophila]